MQDNRDQNTKNGQFVSRTRSSRSWDGAQEASKKKSKEKFRWASLSKKAEEISPAYKKLARRTAVCLLILVGVFAIKGMNTSLSQNIIGEIDRATQETVDMDDELGRLQFVGNTQDGEAEGVASEAYSLPIEGEVISSFADTEKDVKIKSEEKSRVNAILKGVVVKTTTDEVIVENENGTRTTYSGLVPGVRAGDKLDSADMVGQLSGEVLCLETVSGVGYVDSLSAKDVSSAGRKIEN